MLGRLVIFISWDHISPTHLLSIIFKNIYRGIQTTLTEQVATPMLLLSLMVSVGLFLVWEGLVGLGVRYLADMGWECL